MRFDGAYTFAFSPRTGTEAAAMADEFVPADEQQRRLEHLIDVVREIAGERHQRFVGRTEPVLVEGADRKERQRLRGRTPHNVKVNFEGDAAIGAIVPVEIVHATSEIAARTPGGAVARGMSGAGGPRSSPSSGRPARARPRSRCAWRPRSAPRSSTATRRSAIAGCRSSPTSPRPEHDAIAPHRMVGVWALHG